jgi:membrane protein required for colicin V production
MKNFNVLDWVVLGYLGLWLFIVIRGLIKGLIRQLGGLAGLVVGFLAASWWSRDLTRLLRDNLGPFDYWSVVSFGVLFLAGFIACVMVAWFFNYLLNRAELKRWDRLAGGLFALVKGFVLGLVLVFVFSILFSEKHALVRDMRLKATVAKVAGFVYDRFPPNWQQDIQKTRAAIRRGLGLSRPRGMFERMYDDFTEWLDRQIERLKKGQPRAPAGSGPGPTAPAPKPAPGSGTYNWSPIGGGNSG